MSHPSWVRGLKPSTAGFKLDVTESHPSWVRGLKHTHVSNHELHQVAPLVGAWIETLDCSFYLDELRVAPLVGAWIETDSTIDINPQVNVAPLVGAWIETYTMGENFSTICRTPRGCVD